ncbi:MAG TPA: hypothetical protein VEI52_13240 [Terriglobales bacterium]|nr:hypothetical protein [Terriglobales bacterium]
MLEDQFWVRKSSTGYRVELCRGGEPYVTFVDGLTREGAEAEARSLTALWLKISKRRPILVSTARTVEEAS